MSSPTEAGDVFRVAVLDDVHHAYADTDGVRRLRERCAVDIFTEHVAHASLRDYQALVANRERTRFPRAAFETLPNLRLIAQTGNHIYHVDMEAARAHGVVIGKASGGFSRGAAELAIGLAMSIMRGIPGGDQNLRAGTWSAPMGRVLHGKTLGIVGLGKVGRAVARLADAFGMHVLAWGPSLTPAVAAQVRASFRELDDLLAQADVVSIHATLSDRSRGLLDARRLGLMKSTAYLVNTARGPIVDEAALVDALANGRLAGAGLDVFDDEPLPVGHPLTHLPNVVLTPHIGWPTDEAYADFASAAADVVLAYLDGGEVPRFH